MPASRLRALAPVVLLCSLVPATAHAAAKPDLRASRATPPSTLAPGDAFSQKATVRATGAKAKATSAAFYLSADAKLDKRDLALGSAKVKALKAGKKVKVTAQLKVPATTKPGSYRLLACADGTKKVKERNEANNCAVSRAITVQVKAGGQSGAGGQASGSGAPATGGGTDPGNGGGNNPGGNDPGTDPGKEPGGFDPEAPGNGTPGSAGTPTALDQGGTQSLKSSTAFLYTGPNALQQGVAPGTITEQRAAVVRGKLVDEAGKPLPGVGVSILDHAEFGRTTTRADGGFDMVVNGGGELTVQYNRTGYLRSQRTVQVPWQQYAIVDDVTLIQLDDKVTQVDTDSAAPFSVAQGTPTDDGDGKRQATLLFAKGTDATMTMPNGTEKKIDGPLSVRSTEYTQGSDGLAAMPGSLPNTSGYTYAAEFTVDQAAGATSVEFDKPVINYTQNFIGAPVGSNVPTAWYDRTEARWIPSKNGRVIKIVSITNGMADLDVDETPGVDTGAKLTALGITDEERKQLAALHPAGTELWRVALDHFTPWDHNWPYGPDPDATAPDVKDTPPNDDPPQNPCEQAGSIIGCESQTLGERLKITGTPVSLSYRSDRQDGWLAGQNLDIPLAGDTVNPKLKGAILTVDVAGKRYEKRFTDLDPNQRFLFEDWDGKDAFGRQVNGAVPVKIDLRYIYRYQYYASNDDFEASFGRFGDTVEEFSGRETCNDSAQGAFDCGFAMTQTLTRTAKISPPWNQKAAAGLGGWSVAQHHSYDPNGHVLYMGDGTVRAGANAVGQLAGTSSLLAGNPNGPQGMAGDGKPAKDVDVDYLDAMATGPDGSVYIHSSLNQNLIRRVLPNGTIKTIGGAPRTATSDHSGQPEGDGENAVGKILGKGVTSLAVARDGSVYFGTTDETSKNRIRRIGPDGKLSTIGGQDPAPGNGTGDGGPAKNAKITGLREIAIAPDGAIWLGEASNQYNGYVNRIRRIDPSSGIISTEIGGGATDILTGDQGKGSPGAKLNLGGTPRGLSFDNAGDLLFAIPAKHVIERVGGDGLVKRFAGTGQGVTAGNDLDYGKEALQTAIADPMIAVQAPNGTYFVRTYGAADNGNNTIFAIGADGRTRAVAGEPDCQTGGQYTLGPVSPLEDCIGSHAQTGLATTGDSNIIYTDGRIQVRRVHDPMPGFGEGALTIPSADGLELYEFNQNGRHQRTVSASDGHVIAAFGYDAENRLTSITDNDGNKTTIERDATGKPQAIVAPGGQRTEVKIDANGMLGELKNPAGEARKLAYDKGLLTKLTDPAGGEHVFDYDNTGRLESDLSPDGTKKVLTRTVDGDGFSVTVTTKAGRKTKYAVRNLADGTVERKQTDPTGAVSTALQRPDGTTETTTPSGAKSVIEFAGDPRFGLQSPYLSKFEVITPSGRKQTITDERTVEMTDPDVPLSLTKFTSTRTQSWTGDGGGSTSATTRWDRATRTFESTSTEGRKTTQTYDAKGHMVKMTAPGEKVARTLTYDDEGHLKQVVHGDQSATYAYDDKDRVKSTTDALGRKTSLEYDAADRTAAITTPGNRTYRFEYDADGNRTAVKMPGGKVHRLGYTKAGAVKSYTTPKNRALARAFDDDGFVKGLERPSGDTLDLGLDAGGRSTGVNPGANSEPDYGLSYVAGDDRVDHWTTTPAAGGAALQDIAATYDGDQITSMTYTGKAAGAYSYEYNGQLRLDRMKLVSGGDTVDTAISRDDEGHITKLGGFDLTLNGPSGAASAIKDAKLAAQLEYDDVGRFDAHRTKVNAKDVFDLDLTRDKAGRITQRVEKLGGSTITWVNTYDDDGQLRKTTRNGQAIGAWDYDADGNRTSGGATYDEDGVQTGGMGVTSDANGNVVTRGGWTFTYGPSGNLLRAVGSGKTIDYTYDASGHLVAREEGGKKTSFLYGDPDDGDRVTASRGEDGVLTTYLYDQDSRMFALRRGVAQFYVGTDQVGSPRVIADANGDAVRTIEYDPWGKHLAETGSVQVPVGFAGGVEDQDTGLVRFGQRWYDPQTGRFISRDPTLLNGGQFNFYLYVGNDPVGHTDPTGLEWYNNWNEFNSALNDNFGQPVHDFVAEKVAPQWHKIEHYAEKLIGNSETANVWKKGHKALDTANELGEIYVEYEEAQWEQDSGKSGGGILKCILKVIKKAPLPWNPATGASEVLEQGMENVDNYRGMGSKGGDGMSPMDKALNWQTAHD
ncbi:MAG: hypothetical protein JHC95_10795 [Solirubrobacteraceae bacterium]|nr:hypothetical protein [Solirubrobacteraceae bacterium]